MLPRHKAFAAVKAEVPAGQRCVDLWVATSEATCTPSCMRVGDPKGNAIPLLCTRTVLPIKATVILEMSAKCLHVCKFSVTLHTDARTQSFGLQNNLLAVALRDGVLEVVGLSAKCDAAGIAVTPPLLSVYGFWVIVTLIFEILEW